MNPMIKTVSMPLSMVVGALLCRPVMALDMACGHMLTPVLIFLMLFYTFCRVDIRSMRIAPIHLRLLLFQLILSILLYLLLYRIDAVVAQGALICVLTPVAMAAVVIGGMLGANITTMATYSLLCNFTIALVAPVVLSVVGNGECTFLQIFMKVVPLLIMPFVAAQLFRVVSPRMSGWIAEHSQITFYLWLLSLIVIVGRTTTFIIDFRGADPWTEISLAVVALLICIMQFVLGRRIGRRYGDAVAGGQSLGQKNTVLAVWMSQAFLDPLSSIAPTAYIIWQNFVNSFQIYRKDRKNRK